MWKVNILNLKMNLLINFDDDPDDDGGEWSDWIEVDVY